VPLPFKKEKTEYYTIQDIIFQPVQPTLLNTFLKVNTLVFGHPLGIIVKNIREELPRLEKVADRLREIKDTRYINGEPLVRVQLFYHVHSPPRVKIRASEAVQRYREQLDWVLGFATATTNRLLVYAEARAINIDDFTEYPVSWLALALADHRYRHERTYVPGMSALVTIAGEMYNGKDEVTIVDWDLYRKIKPDDQPRGNIYILFLAKLEDGKVIYASAYNMNIIKNYA
jgi:hypothetical protein